MTLTKKHRIVWDNDLNIIVLLKDCNSMSRTYTNRNYFESDNYSDIENKISELSLIMPQEEGEQWTE